MKLKFFILPFILTLSLFTSCKRREDIGSNITRAWFVDGGKDSLNISKTDFQFFSNELQGKGKWEVSADSVLKLTFDLKPLALGIDSASYQVKESQPNIIYFKNKKEIARLGVNGLSTDKVIRTYKVLVCDNEKIVLRDGQQNVHTYSCIQYNTSGSISFASVFRGIIGILFLTFVLFLLSTKRKAISLKLVAGGILFQIVFALLILKVPFVATIFEYVSNFFVEVLEFTKAGSSFVFGSLLDTKSFGFVFAFQILPTILFFSALTSIFFYLGILQKIVYGLSWLMGKVMKMSGAENLSTSANIFLGQTEAPLMIKPYLEKMTRSEMLCIMVGGMANTAGGVLAAYVGFLGGDDPVQQLFFAKHLLAASIMSAPATIVVSKMMIPQTEEVDETMEISNEKLGTNLLEAISVGTTDGLKLAVNVAAMLIVFIALTFMLNKMLVTFGEWTNLNQWIAGISNGQYRELSLQALFAYPCSIVTLAIGVSSDDMLLVGQLLGEKTVINEFNAYISLSGMKMNHLFTEQKSVIMATYILSGFANFASIGIQIGGIGALAPGKRGMLSELGMKALIGGTIASLFTATIVGMLI